MNEDVEFMTDLVKKASLLIDEDFEVKAKGDKGDLVTNFDYEIEKYIIDHIKREYPDFSIISEEFNSDNRLTDNCFTIDPIDGTINFAHGIPLWGIQMACIRNSKTCAAVIYLPKLNELYYADESGAYLNGKLISVNDCETDKGLYTVEGPGKLIGSIKMQKISRHIRDFYCAAVNYAFVACGRLSATNFICDTPWDYVPGQFIVERAGGIIYNDKKVHIAANNKEFLDLMKTHSTIKGDEQITIEKK